MGTMTASSSALRNLLSHAMLVTRFRPVSPSTKYAFGRLGRTGMRGAAGDVALADLAGCVLGHEGGCATAIDHCHGFFSLVFAGCLPDDGVEVCAFGSAAACGGGCGAGLRVWLCCEGGVVFQEGVNVDVAVLIDVLICSLLGLKQRVINVGDFAGQLSALHSFLLLRLELLQLLLQVSLLSLDAFSL